MTTMHGMQAQRLTTMQRLWRHLGFGARAPAQFKWKHQQLLHADEQIIRTTVRLGRRDRLRLIVSGSMVVETRTLFKAQVDPIKTNSAVGILPPF